MSRRSLLGDVFAAALGGALYCAGHVAWGLWPLAFVCWVPLWHALDRTPSLARAAGLGLVFGAVAHAAGFAFLLHLIEPFLGGKRALGLALFTGHGLWFAAGFAAMSVGFVALRARGRSVALSAIAPIVAVEWAQPQLFPAPFGASLVHALPLAQAADLGGPQGLTAFLVAMNVAAFEAWRSRGAARAPVAIAALLLLANLAYGAASMTPSASHDGLRVGLVQANLGLREKRELATHSHAKHVALSRELLDAGEIDLLVWPETAYGLPLQRRLPLSGAPIRQGLDVPLLFGATTTEERDGKRVRTNSALLVDAGGRIEASYDKRRLVPVAETAPFVKRWPALAARFPHAQRFAPGSALTGLTLGRHTLATPICQEILFAGTTREHVAASNADVIVTLANDAWFGDSRGAAMHLAMARLRAIELRRPLVRATNSGISAIVDATGRITAKTGLLEETTLRGSVVPSDAGTLYARLGDWPGPLALATAALGLVLPPGGEGRGRRR